MRYTHAEYREAVAFWQQMHKEADKLTNTKYYPPEFVQMQRMATALNQAMDALFRIKNEIECSIDSHTTEIRVINRIEMVLPSDWPYPVFTASDPEDTA